MSEVTFYRGNGNHSVYELEKMVRERDEDIYQRQLEKQTLKSELSAKDERVKELEKENKALVEMIELERHKRDMVEVALKDKDIFLKQLTKSTELQSSGKG